MKADQSWRLLCERKENPVRELTDENKRMDRPKDIPSPQEIKDALAQAPDS